MPNSGTSLSSSALITGRLPIGEITGTWPDCAMSYIRVLQASTAAPSIRIPQEPHFRIIRVMCSGTVSPHHVLRAFQKGADGVLIGGCHIGDCHYLRGNYMTIKKGSVTGIVAPRLAASKENSTCSVPIVSRSISNSCRHWSV